MTTPQLRSAEVEDLPSLMTIYHRAVRELARDLYDESQLVAWAPDGLDEDHWRRRLAGREIILAERDGQAAGFIAFMSTGYIDLLFTHPDHARAGIASQLVMETEDRLRKCGVIQAHTSASLVSRPLFEKLGFQAISEEVATVRGAQLRHTNMTKFL